MLSYIRGVVIDLGSGYLVINPNSGDLGLGYKVFTTPATLDQIKLQDTVTFHLHYRGREDGVELYGFTTKAELSLFQMLISVSGVGPKSALNVLSVAALETIIAAIQTNQPSLLQAIPGIGAKTAGKIVLELQNKAKEFALADTSGNLENLKSINPDILSALQSLGYKKSEIEKRLKPVKFSGDDLASQLKQALQFMSR